MPTENSVLARIPHIELPRLHEKEVRVLSGIVFLGNAQDYRVQKAMMQLERDCFTSKYTRDVYEILNKMFHDNEDMSLVNLLTKVDNDTHMFVEQAIRTEFYTGNFLDSDVRDLLEIKAYRKQLQVIVSAINESLEDSLNPSERLEIIADGLQKLNQSNGDNRQSLMRSYETIIDEILSQSNEDHTEFKVDIPNMPCVPNQALITIAGRSGHGKTFFALYLMNAIIDAKPDKQALYFNLEMHESVMTERHARLIGGRGATQKEVLQSVDEELKSKNVLIVSEPMITIEQIDMEARLAALKKPLSVIVVDYLGLVRTKTKFERKESEQSEIVARLTKLAMDLKCIVIALIQVNRDFKTRPIGDRCPRTEDSADSMAAVRSATWWLGIDQPQNDDGSDEFKDLFLVECRKNRHGSVFGLRFKFKNGMFSKWERPFSVGYKKAEIDGF